MQQEILLLIFGFVFTAVILIYVVKKVMPVSPFLYSNARIQAKSNLLITDQKIHDLTDSKSLRELVNKIKDSDYIQEVDKVNIDNLQEIHAALEKSFLRSVDELLELSPKKIKPLFKSYIIFFEAKILKTIYRAKFSNISINEDLVFPIGNIDEEILKHLLEAKTVADIGVVLEPTPYKDVFKKKYSTTEEFEIALDGFVLNNFIKKAQEKMYEAQFIIDMVEKKADILNILALLKMRVRNTPKEKQIKLLIDNKTELSERFNDLINATDIAKFVDICKGLPYHEALTKALEKYNKDGLLANFEYELYRFYKKYVIDAELAHTLGPYPLFSFLTKKEIESRNLFVISKGIDSKLNPEQIREMVIWLF